MVYGIASTKSMIEFKAEILGLHRHVQKLFGSKMRFYRPGTAFIDHQALLFAQKNGYKVIAHKIDLSQNPSGILSG